MISKSQPLASCLLPLGSWLLVLVTWFLTLGSCNAQEFDIRSFTKDPVDLAARVNEKRTVNNEPCALIKVVTPINAMQFDAGQGIVELLRVDDGYWVYVQPRERRIKLMAANYLSLDVPLPEPAIASVVYKLVIAPKGMVQTTDLVKVTFRLNQENVYIRLGKQAPVVAPGRSAVFNVTKGKHSFRFIKDQFDDLVLDLDIQGEMVKDVELIAGGKTSELALSGHILVATNPAGAEVYLNDQQVGVSPYQGRNIAGSYQLRVKYPLYHEHLAQFELKEGETVTLPTIELKPRFGYYQLESTPAGAEVWIDGKKEGVTPLARKQIGSGQHSLVVRLSEYYEHKETFTVKDGETKSFSIALKEAFGSLLVTSDPSEASVFIDGKEVGKTPFSKPRYPSGTYELRVAKDLHADVREVVEVKDGVKTEKFLVLPKNFGTLTVTAESSEIFVNDKPVGFSSYTVNLSAGSYKVMAVRDKHRTVEREVFISNGQREEIKLTPVPLTGALSITTTPFATNGASISLNGEKRTEKTPASISLMIGDYDLLVSKPGYLDVRRQVTVTEGREQELVIPMQTYEGSVAQQVKKYKNAKLFYGTLTLAALGSGGYFRYSTLKLAEDYKTATTDATTVYDTMEKHNLYTTISFVAAAPLAVMTVVKMIQQSKAQKKMRVAVLPTQEGMNVFVTYNF